MTKTALETRLLGSIIVSEAIFVGDPCYPSNNLANLDDLRPGSVQEVEVDTGKYWACISIRDEGSGGLRVAELRLTLEGAEAVELEYYGDVGVDSGQMMMADIRAVRAQWVGDGENYNPADHHYEFNYNGACAATLGDKHDWGGVGDGYGGMIGVGLEAGPHLAVVSSSGYGDGCYPVYLLRDKDSCVVGVSVAFLQDDDDEEAS